MCVGRGLPWLRVSQILVHSSGLTFTIRPSSRDGGLDHSEVVRTLPFPGTSQNKYDYRGHGPSYLLIYLLILWRWKTWDVGPLRFTRGRGGSFSLWSFLYNLFYTWCPNVVVSVTGPRVRSTLWLKLGTCLTSLVRSLIESCLPKDKDRRNT